MASTESHQAGGPLSGAISRCLWPRCLSRGCGVMAASRAKGLQAAEKFFGWYAKFVFDHKALVAVGSFLVLAALSIGVVLRHAEHEMYLLYSLPNTPAAASKAAYAASPFQESREIWMLATSTHDHLDKTSLTNLQRVNEQIEAVSVTKREALKLPKGANEAEDQQSDATVKLQIEWPENLDLDEFNDSYSFSDLCVTDSVGRCARSSIIDAYPRLSLLGRPLLSRDWPVVVSAQTQRMMRLDTLVGNATVQQTNQGGTPLWILRNATAFAFRHELTSQPGLAYFSAALEEKIERVMNRAAIPDMQITYKTERSINDELSRTSTMELGDLLRLLIAVTLVFTYTMGTSSSRCHRTKTVPAFFGCVAALLGYASGSGILHLFGVPHTPPAEATPFLVLGIGVDDVFVILNAYSLTFNTHCPRQRLAMAVKDAGVSITLTTLTNIVAFLVGWLSPYYSISIFCLITANALLFGYIACLTLFLAVLAWDVEREANGIKLLPAIKQALLFSTKHTVHNAKTDKDTCVCATQANPACMYTESAEAEIAQTEANTKQRNPIARIGNCCRGFSTTTKQHPMRQHDSSSSSSRSRSSKACSSSDEVGSHPQCGQNVVKKNRSIYCSRYLRELSAACKETKEQKPGPAEVAAGDAKSVTCDASDLPRGHAVRDSSATTTLASRRPAPSAVESSTFEPLCRAVSWRLRSMFGVAPSLLLHDGSGAEPVVAALHPHAARACDQAGPSLLDPVSPFKLPPLSGGHCDGLRPLGPTSSQRDQGQATRKPQAEDGDGRLLLVKGDATGGGDELVVNGHASVELRGVEGPNSDCHSSAGEESRPVSCASLVVSPRVIGRESGARNLPGQEGKEGSDDEAASTANRDASAASAASAARAAAGPHAHRGACRLSMTTTATGDSTSSDGEYGDEEEDGNAQDRCGFASGSLKGNGEAFDSGPFTAEDDVISVRNQSSPSRGCSPIFTDSRVRVAAQADGFEKESVAESAYAVVPSAARPSSYLSPHELVARHVVQLEWAKLNSALGLKTIVTSSDGRREDSSCQFRDGAAPADDCALVNFCASADALAASPRVRCLSPVAGALYHAHHNYPLDDATSPCSVPPQTPLDLNPLPLGYCQPSCLHLPSLGPQFHRNAPAAPPAASPASSCQAGTHARALEPRETAPPSTAGSQRVPRALAPSTLHGAAATHTPRNCQPMTPRPQASSRRVGPASPPSCHPLRPVGQASPRPAAVVAPPAGSSRLTKAKRAELDGQRDIVLCAHAAANALTTTQQSNEFDRGGNGADEPLDVFVPPEPPGNIGKFSRYFFLKVYGRMMALWWFKALVLISFAVYVALALVGAFQLKSGLSLKDITPYDSFLRTFYDIREIYFTSYGEKVVVFFPTGPGPASADSVDWSDPSVRAAARELHRHIDESESSMVVANGMETFYRTLDGLDDSTAAAKAPQFSAPPLDVGLEDLVAGAGGFASLEQVVAKGGGSKGAEQAILSWEVLDQRPAERRRKFDRALLAWLTTDPVGVNFRNDFIFQDAEHVRSPGQLPPSEEAGGEEEVASVPAPAAGAAEVLSPGDASALQVKSPMGAALASLAASATTASSSGAWKAPETISPPVSAPSDGAGGRSSYPRLQSWRFAFWMPYSDNTLHQYEWLEATRTALGKQSNQFHADIHTNLAVMWESDPRILRFTFTNLASALAAITFVSKGTSKHAGRNELEKLKLGAGALVVLKP
eukprot:GHVT01034615.1.p1 GENE.GHVT01034615.1~~GHVT01034615.1.p1  ORF type:complete len:1724 (+),score=377.06 GHVT01034615.1:732-5903(+)